MPRSAPPYSYGYTVVQLDDKQWYPVEILRLYSAESPDGDIRLSIVHTFNENREWVPACYPRRDGALQHAHTETVRQHYFEQLGWQKFTVTSDVYPERCFHFLELIQEITGHLPHVHRWLQEITVSIDAYHCSCGRFHHRYWDSSQVTIEDVLQQAAEYAYSHRCSCTASTAYEYEQRLAV